MNYLFETAYFSQTGEFYPVELSERLWKEFGNAYSGMEFPLPDEAAEMTFESALTKLYEIVETQAGWNAREGLQEKVLGAYFVAQIAALIETLIQQAIRAGIVSEFGEVKRGENLDLIQ